MIAEHLDIKAPVLCICVCVCVCARAENRVREKSVRARGVCVAVIHIGVTG